MPIRFHCSQCDTRIRVPDGSEGKRVRCPKCSNRQRVPGGPPVVDIEPVTGVESLSSPGAPTPASAAPAEAPEAPPKAPDVDLISIGAADPKDKSKPKRFKPSPVKVDSSELIQELEKLENAPAVDLEPAPPIPEAQPPEEEAPPPDEEAPPPDEEAPPPEEEASAPEAQAPPAVSQESHVSEAYAASPPVAAAPPDEPQAQEPESDLALHDAEAAEQAPAEASPSLESDDLAALAALSVEDEQTVDETPELPQGKSETAVADERRAETAAAAEAKPKAPPSKAPRAIPLDDTSAKAAPSTRPPAKRSAAASASGRPTPVPDAFVSAPPMPQLQEEPEVPEIPEVPEATAVSETTPPEESSAVAPRYGSAAQGIPTFTGLLIFSWLLRFLGSLLFIMTCVAAVRNPFEDSVGENRVTRIVLVLAGLTPALICWSLAEALAALRRIGQNNFR